MQTQKIIIVEGREFHQVQGASRYYVSREGAVYSTIRDRLLKLHNNGIGYLQVWLKLDDGTEKWKKVHRLVAVCFLPNQDQTLDVNHIDGNKANNHVSNLEWSTRSENIQHAVNTGLRKTPKGEAHHMHGWKHSAETKAKMAAAKQGANHPKFSGHYQTPAGTFPTLGEAAAANDVSASTVRSWCKGGKHQAEGWDFLPALRPAADTDTTNTQREAA